MVQKVRFYFFAQPNNCIVILGGRKYDLNEVSQIVKTPMGEARLLEAPPGTIVMLLGATVEMKPNRIYVFIPNKIKHYCGFIRLVKSINGNVLVLRSGSVGRICTNGGRYVFDINGIHEDKRIITTKEDFFRAVRTHPEWLREALEKIPEFKVYVDALRFLKKLGDEVNKILPMAKHVL